MNADPIEVVTSSDSRETRLQKSLRWGWKTDLAIMLVGDASLSGGLVFLAAVVLGRFMLVPGNRVGESRKVV
jgi:hypothetical protein